MNKAGKLFTRNNETRNLSILELEFITCIIISEIDEINYRDVFHHLENYGIQPELIYKRGYDSFLTEEFIILWKGRISMHDNQIIAFKKTNEFIKNLEKLKSNELDIESEFSENSNYAKIAAHLIFNNKIVEKHQLYGYFKYYTDRNNHIAKLVLGIDDLFDSLEIDKISDIERTNHLFGTMNVYTVRKLRTLSSNFLLLLFFDCYENFISLLESLQRGVREKIMLLIDDTFCNVTEKEKDIIQRRYINDSSITLEEIGAVYNVTRERIRQIEVKAIKKLTINSQLELSIVILYETLRQSNDYLSLCEIEDFFKSKEHSDRFKFICYFYGKIRFNKDSNLFYDNSNDFSVIQNGILSDYRNILKKDEIDKKHEKVLLLNYNDRGTIIVKKGIPKRQLILDIIDEFFDNGYRISSIEDYNKFSCLYMNAYECQINDIPTQRSVTVALENAGYCLIDRGTYKNEKFCALITEELIKQIEEYIIGNPPLVYYKSIYTVFKKELDSLGIVNFFYLKGLLDKRIKTIFKTNRDYINVTSENINSHDIIASYITESAHGTNYGELRSKFPGVSDYVFYSAFYLNKDILTLSAGRLWHSKYLRITPELKTRIKSIIDSLLLSSNINITTSSKIFAKINIFYKDILKKLYMIENSQDFYILIFYMFEGEYSFNRPFISEIGKNDVNYDIILKNYIAKERIFGKKMLDNFCDKMNTRRIDNYLNFMIENSNLFMQITKDSMKLREDLGFSSNEIHSINSIIDTYIKRFQLIDLSSTNVYSIIPKKDGVIWGKYSLLGFIRSFLGDVYDIEYTDKTYDKTNFIIRRMCDE